MSSFDINILKTITILYVEDEAGLREQELKAYNKLFKEVFPCEDGEDAWKCFLNNKDNIDIIITDINMPVLNGLELLQRVIKVSDIPFILTTAHTDSDYLLEAIELGVKKYVTKPINIKNLVEDIQNVVIQERKENKIKSIARNLLQEAKNTEIQISDLTLQNRELKQELVLTRNTLNQYVSKIVTDKNGIIIDISSRLCELLDFTQSEIFGKNISFLQDDSCINGSFQKQMLHIVHKKIPQTSDFIIKSNNAEKIKFTIDISATLDYDGLVKSYTYYFNQHP